MRILVTIILLSIVSPSIVTAGLKSELNKHGYFFGKIGDTPIVIDFETIYSSKKWENRLEGGEIDFDVPWFFYECEDIGSYHGRITLFEPIKGKPLNKNRTWVKGQQVAEILLTRIISRDGGVGIVEWIAPNALIAGKQTSFFLKKSYNDGYAIKLMSCGNQISLPGLVAVLIRPDFRNNAEEWFKNKGYIFRKSRRYFDYHMKRHYGNNFNEADDKKYDTALLEFYKLQNYKEVLDEVFYGYYGYSAETEWWNLYILQVPIGNEFVELKEILKQKWVFDASIDFHLEGPADCILSFPGESIFRNIGEQQVLRQRLISVLKQKFTSIDISIDNVVVYRSGLSYKFKLKAPMVNLGNREFEGYWLKADVIFECHHNINEGKVSDNIVIKIPDGFLARWDRSDVPPDGHFDHLSPEGKTKYHNFSSLGWLMDVIGNHIAQSWNGTFENPNL